MSFNFLFPPTPTIYYYCNIQRHQSYIHSIVLQLKLAIKVAWNDYL